jgi:hypothetical protein
MNGITTDPIASDMPETDAPNLVPVKISLPAPLVEMMTELAAAEGWKPAELHRVIWERGFALYVEGSNKRLINQQLREKMSRGDRSLD